MLTPNERERYDRQIMIQDIGVEGQEKLKRSRVLVAGAGGLGSPIAIYLTAAGVGTIRLIDHDQVTLSNLNRQILHWEEDIGRKKTDSATTKLSHLNSGVTLEAIAETITEENVSQLVRGCDVIVDAMDNLPTRYVLNRCAVEKKIPFFHGAVSGFEGRVMTILPGKNSLSQVHVSRSVSTGKISSHRRCSSTRRSHSGDGSDQVSRGNRKAIDQSATHL